MKIEILREKRRSIVLKVVNSEKSILKVPKGLSEKDISKFIESKKKWLMNTAFKFRLNESFAENFDLKQNLYLKGEKVLESKMLNLNFQGLTQKQQQKSERDGDRIAYRTTRESAAKPRPKQFASEHVAERRRRRAYARQYEPRADRGGGYRPYG